MVRKQRLHFGTKLMIVATSFSQELIALRGVRIKGSLKQL
ncbi:unnamed protein product, partial [marine sediment metagenome]